MKAMDKWWVNVAILTQSARGQTVNLLLLGSIPRGWTLYIEEIKIPIYKISNEVKGIQSYPHSN